jgi:argininosuccinate lyase
MTAAEPLVEAATERALEIGGRLAEPPSPRLMATAFAEELISQRELFGELGLVDLAHTITLAEQGVIPSASARRLVAALLELQQDAATFQSDAACGDLYTNREARLAARTDAVGWLGVSRARREALTTAYHRLTRGRLLDLLLASRWCSSHPRIWTA